MNGTAQEDCVFCRIASGEIPSTRVYEDDALLAFLDIRPVREGHVLIMPKQHYDYYEQMPAELAAAVIVLGQKLGRVAKKLYGVARVGFMFTGTDVAHTHAHVIPLVEATDLTSRRYIAEEKITFQPLPAASPADLEDVATKLKAALAEA